MFKVANEIWGSIFLKLCLTVQLKNCNKQYNPIYIHSVILAEIIKQKKEFFRYWQDTGGISALTAGEVLTFEDGLKLVKIRFKKCKKLVKIKSQLWLVLQLENTKVEEVCNSSEGIVVPANYNCPGQIVISVNLKQLKKLKNLNN